MPRRHGLVRFCTILFCSTAVNFSTAQNQQTTKHKEAFDGLPPVAIIEHAIGVADIAFGESLDSPNETLTFTGPVKVQKWPMEGYSRTVLPDGRAQISAE